LGSKDEVIVSNKKKLELVNEEEDNKIKTMVDQLRKECEIQNKDYEQRKSAI